MAKIKRPKTLAEQIADLDDPAPRDLDPEQEDEHSENNSSSGAEDGNDNSADAREHYVDVGKSRLRKSEGIDLGPQYKGSSISRDALRDDDIGDDPFASHSDDDESEPSEHVDGGEDLDLQGQDDDQEIDSGEAFESGDQDRFAGYKFGGSKNTGPDMEEDSPEESAAEAIENDDGDQMDATASEIEEPQDDVDTEMDHDQDIMDSDSDNTSISSTPNEPKADDRAALRKMISEEQKTVAASLSKAAKADIAKGRAIKQQRTAFDALLNTRIKLQKALISTNSLGASTSTSTADADSIRAAEKAALNLWTTISTLRSTLHPSPSPPNPPNPATLTTPLSTLWTQMQSHETASLPTRRNTLTKWSQRTNPTAALPRTSRFTQTPSQQPLTSILDQHLSGSSLDNLLAKTHVPRSCAPIQAAARQHSDPAIYDDADFYTVLLRELVDRRMADSSAVATSAGGNDGVSMPVLPSQREFRVRKQVDTKASKGRKMRYTVHEKLQNFMAPEDRGSWGEKQRVELFGSLFGRRVVMEEEREGDGDGGGSGSEVEMDGGEGGEAGLRLFG